jgi:hypothetical protein
MIRLRRLVATAKRLTIAGLALLIVAAPAATAGGPVTVLATSAYELNPAASADYLAWDIAGRKNAYDVYAKPFGGSRVHVNQNRTRGATGSIDGTKLVYQQWTVGSSAGSSIYLYDFQRHRRTKVPSPVNTAKWEYSPSLSGPWLMFARWFARSDDRKIYVYNRTTGVLRGVVTTTGSHVDLWPMQINGRYAVYEVDRLNHDDTKYLACEVFRYDVQTRTSTRIPNPFDRCQYAPSVSSEGTVYYARSGLADCPSNVKLIRNPLGSPEETLYILPAGHYMLSSYAFDNGDATTDVFWDDIRCQGGADIRKLTAAT